MLIPAILMLCLCSNVSVAFGSVDGKEHLRQSCDRNRNRGFSGSQLISPARPWVHASKGSAVVLRCFICAKKPFKVWWAKDGEMLPANSPRTRQVEHRKAHRSSTLKIKSFRGSDFGTYRCNLRSNSNLTTAGSDIQVSGHPYPGVFDIPSEWTDTTFTLSWRVNSSLSAPIIDYRLEFRRSSDSDSFSDWIAVTIPATGDVGLRSKAGKRGSRSTQGEFLRTYVLKGLTPGQNYEAKVRGRNAYGSGDYSDVFHFLTLESLDVEDKPTFTADYESLMDLELAKDGDAPLATRRSQGFMGHSGASRSEPLNVCGFAFLVLTLIT